MALQGLTRNGKMVMQVPCTDVYPVSAFKEAEQSLVFQAITMSEAVWEPGSKGKITITFGGFGCPGCSPDAAWSHIGNNSTNQYPSMNLGFIDPPFESFTWKGKIYKAGDYDQRNYCGKDASGKYVKSKCENKWRPGATVIHEFCHALSMLHEHQNNLENSNEIKLNRQNVIDYYNSIGLGEEGAVTNVLERYSCNEGEDCKYDGTKYDKNSIMLYALPDNWVEGTNPTYPNFELSNDDKGWLKEIYPKNIDNYPKITVEFVDQNPEPWKVAWVEKMVTETFTPLIGIDWDFKTDQILGTVKSVKESGKQTVEQTEQPTSQPTGQPISTVEQFTDGEIAGIFFGVLFGVASLALLGYLIYRNVEVDRKRHKRR